MKKYSLLTILFFSIFISFSKPIKLKKYQVNQNQMTGYMPVDQKVYWMSNRPICNNGQSLIVPAAFTHKNGQIVGASIDWGKVINPILTSDLSGVCIIKLQKPSIINLNQIDNAQIVQLSKVGVSVFQQDLLVQGGHTLPISHAAAIDLWRALVIFVDRFEVVENDVMMNRLDFQSALIKIGAIHAIYLDMGTWSEGAYYSENNKVVKIGKMRQNTHNQTNWLVFH